MCVIFTQEKDLHQVRDVLADQPVRVELRGVNLLDKIVPERENSGPEIPRVERHIDTGQRNGRETSVENNRTVLLLFLLHHVPTALNNLSQLLLNFLNAHHCAKLLQVDLLDLEHVKHIGKGSESTEFTGADVLLVGNVKVDNLEENRLLLADGVDNLSQSHLVESLAYSRRIGSHHRVLRLALGITLDSALHGDTSEEDDIGKR